MIRRLFVRAPLSHGDAAADRDRGHARNAFPPVVKMRHNCYPRPPSKIALQALVPGMRDIIFRFNGAYTHKLATVGTASTRRI